MASRYCGGPHHVEDRTDVAISASFYLCCCTSVLLKDEMKTSDMYISFPQYFPFSCFFHFYLEEMALRKVKCDIISRNHRVVKRDVQHEKSTLILSVTQRSSQQGSLYCFLEYWCILLLKAVQEIV